MAWAVGLFTLRATTDWLDLLPGVFVFQPWLPLWWFAIALGGPAAFVGGLIGAIAGATLFAGQPAPAATDLWALLAASTVAWRMQASPLRAAVAAALTHTAWMALLADASRWFPFNDAALVLLIHHGIGIGLGIWPLHHLLRDDAPTVEHPRSAGLLGLGLPALAIGAGWLIGSIVYGIQLSTVPAIGLHSGPWTEFILMPLLLAQLALLFVRFGWSSATADPNGPMRWQNLME